MKPTFKCGAGPAVIIRSDHVVHRQMLVNVIEALIADLLIEPFELRRPITKTMIIAELRKRLDAKGTDGVYHIEIMWEFVPKPPFEKRNYEVVAEWAEDLCNEFFPEF